MSIWITGLTAPVALAAVALFGYLFGRRRRRFAAQDTAVKLQMHRANSMINQLETISQQLRRNLAEHHSTVSHCHEQIRALGDRGEYMNIHEHVQGIREMLAPTERLTRDIAAAYDELRRHATTLQHLRSQS